MKGMNNNPQFQLQEFLKGHQMESLESAVFELYGDKVWTMQGPIII